MILVTGSAGLVGSELIKQLLAKGKSVRAIYNKNMPALSISGLQQVTCSISDVIGLEEAMKGIDEVYHCAGLVSFSPRFEEQLNRINVEGTANVVNVALEQGVRKLVHVSSVSALGRLRKGEAVNENMQWTADTSNSKYGESKFLGEMEVWRGVAEGLNAVIINPSIILGSGDWEGGSTRIFKSVYNEFPWYTEGVSGFVDVRDVASAMILLMESNVSAERFIVSAYNETYKNVFYKMAEHFNVKPPYRKVTPFLAALVWRWQAIKSIFNNKDPLLTKETAATAFAEVYYDNNKLLNIFPSFNYRPLDDTIRDTCNALQQKLNNP
ncbi:MAG: NAD-dependent epimerase/dehydratase family protein [Ferruginibacter sp.]